MCIRDRSGARHGGSPLSKGFAGGQRWSTGAGVGWAVTFAGAWATPVMAGRTNGGQFGRHDCRHVEAAVHERLQRRTVAIAADYELVEPVEAVLAARRLRVCRADVLDEQEPAAWAQHPADLPHRPGLVVDAAEHQG